MFMINNIIRLHYIIELLHLLGLELHILDLLDQLKATVMLSSVFSAKENGC